MKETTILYFLFNMSRPSSDVPSLGTASELFDVVY